MSLKDAFAGIREAQAPENSGTQAPKPLSAEGPKNPRSEAPRHRSAEAPKRPSAGVPGTAKSKHPDFEPVKIYIRSETRKQAWRKWEDAQGGDFSDLVEMLLSKYLRA